MHVFFYVSGQQIKEISQKTKPAGTQFFFSDSLPTASQIDDFDAFFLLKEEVLLFGTPRNQAQFDEIKNINFKRKEVILNAVVFTLDQLDLPANFSRIIAWPGFLQREVWEIGFAKNASFSPVTDSLGWKVRKVKDAPGLISARVISMIINEAFFALKDGVSTPSEINLAMKLGTNYPYGPFEWVEKIGIASVFDLLTKLAESDTRYTPAFSRDEIIP